MSQVQHRPQVRYIFSTLFSISCIFLFLPGVNGQRGRHALSLVSQIPLNGISCDCSQDSTGRCSSHVRGRDGHEAVVVKSEGGKRTGRREGMMIYQECHMVVPPRSPTRTHLHPTTVQSTLPLSAVTQCGAAGLVVRGCWLGGSPRTDGAVAGVGA